MDPQLANTIMMMGLNVVFASVCALLGLVAMVVGYKIFDKLTPYATGEELANGNLAVAAFNSAIVLGVGLCFAIIIGLACN